MRCVKLYWWTELLSQLLSDLMPYVWVIEVVLRGHILKEVGHWRVGKSPLQRNHNPQHMLQEVSTMSQATQPSRGVVLAWPACHDQDLLRMGADEWDNM
jgi:hypothetical protein